MSVNSSNSLKSNGDKASTSTAVSIASSNGENTTRETKNNYISMVNVNKLSKEQSTSIISYINKIYKQNLPVKCILLTLKTVIRNIECDMAEICQVVESNLVVNHVSKESMILHKKVINCNEIKSTNWLYSKVYSSIMKNKEISNVIYINGNKANNYANSNPNTTTKVNNILWVPLYDIHEMIWGALLIYNVRGEETQEPEEVLKREEEQEAEPEDQENPESEQQSGEVTEEESEFESNEEELLKALTPEDLNYLQELSYIGGIVISNMTERIDLEMNKNKSNSLITLMHSLFSDQLSIQSIIISLTTHAKKLLQVESCTIYLFDHLHNQLLSISSNKCIINNNVNVNGTHGLNLSNVDELVSSSQDLNSDILLYCLHSCNVIIYDSNYNNANGSTHERNTSVRNNNVVIVKEVNENFNNIRNGIWIPIKSEANKLLGILEVVNKQERELLNFTEDDLDLLLLFTIIITPQFEKFEFVNLYNKSSPELNNNIELINNATPPPNNANAATLELNNNNANLNPSPDAITEAGLAFEYNINIKNNLNNLNNIKNFLDYSIKEEEVEEE